MRVAVVGGGAVGITAAHDLAAAGVDVRLFERDEELGDSQRRPRDRIEGSSHRAAGVLAPRPVDAADARIGERAMDRFEWLAERDHRFTFAPRPHVTLVAEGDQRKVEALRAQVDAASEHGVDIACHDPETIAERFPALDVSGVELTAVTERGGFVVPGPGMYVRAMADRAADLGVELWTDIAANITHRGDGPRVNGERFDAVVVAAGGWSKRVLAPTGVQLPLKPYRVQALVSETPYDGPMVHDTEAGVYFRPHPDGLLAGDGTVPEECDPDDWEPAGDEWFVDGAIDSVESRTDLQVESDGAWAGIATATPDGEPLLGEVLSGLYVGAGWQGHGFMRAPATGEALAEVVLGEREPPDGFAPDRFEGQAVDDFEIREGMEL